MTDRLKIVSIRARNVPRVPQALRRRRVSRVSRCWKATVLCPFDPPSVHRSPNL